MTRIKDASSSPLDYNQLRSAVAAELAALQTECTRLHEQLTDTERRSSQITVREEKITQLIASLTDLLATTIAHDESLPNQVSPVMTSTGVVANVGDSGEAAPPIAADVAAVQIEAVTNQPADGSTADGELTTDAMATAATAAATAPPTDQPSVSADKVGEPAGQSAAIIAGKSAQNDVGAVAEIAPAAVNIKPPPEVASFDPADFFRQNPNISTTHPAHILARKLLEYFGRGLKLAEIARLIEALGYRHESRNFTDSVHSALKNKRAASGEFRFNRDKSVWELGGWETSAENDQAAKQPAQKSYSQPVEKAAEGEQLTAAAKAGDNAARVKTTAAGANNFAGKRLAKNGISLYKG